MLRKVSYILRGRMPVHPQHIENCGVDRSCNLFLNGIGSGLKLRLWIYICIISASWISIIIKIRNEINSCSKRTIESGANFTI